MAYRDDTDLSFLDNCSSDDLDILVNILTKDKDGVPRLTEKLSKEDRCILNKPDHHQYWDLIAAEIQHFGANTFVTMIRGGEGVLYREILINACDKMKVNYSVHATVETIEMNLLMKVFTDSMVKMTPKELEALVQEFDIKTTDFTKQAIIAAVLASIRYSGFSAYKMSAIVANAVAKSVIGRGLSFATGYTLTRSMAALTGPIGWVITTLWTVLDISGPAYRITIPCIVQVAFLRAKLKHQESQFKNYHTRTSR